MQQKDVIALLAWLESFPAFQERVLPEDEDYDNADVMSLLRSLDKSRVLL